MVEKSQMEKVEVKVDWEADSGDCSCWLRFTGEEVDQHQIGPINTTLYQDYTGGYRVYKVDEKNNSYGRLFPEGLINQQTGFPTYNSRYTAAEIVKYYPHFAETLGEAIDID